MTEQQRTIGVRQWMQSFPDAMAEMAGGKIKRHPEHVGETLRMSDGRTYTPFRNTVRTADALREPVVLHPRFHLRSMRAGQSFRYWLFKRVCILTTPFFVGLAGFRSKLWMVDKLTGDFAGLYQWDGKADAIAYADGLGKILRALSVTGSVSYEITQGAVDEYLKRYRSVAPIQA